MGDKYLTMLNLALMTVKNEIVFPLYELFVAVQHDLLRGVCVYSAEKNEVIE